MCHNLLTAHFDASSHDRLFGQPTPAIQRRSIIFGIFDILFSIFIFNIGQPTPAIQRRLTRICMIFTRQRMRIYTSNGFGVDRSQKAHSYKSWGNQAFKNNHLGWGESSWAGRMAGRSPQRSRCQVKQRQNDQLIWVALVSQFVTSSGFLTVQFFSSFLP